MSTKSSLLDEASSAFNRRSFLRKAGFAGVVGALAPELASMLGSSAEAATPSPDLDLAILNFALNLEYLEAQYYIHAVTGGGISENGGTTATRDGKTAGGSLVIKANSKVPFTNSVIADYAAEIAQDEFNHVKFLQTALGDAYVAAPNLDLLNSFNTLAQVAGLGDAFDPFANDLNFLLGAFIFEDVGVTAYHGAAPLIYNKDYLGPAGGILAVEAFHASEVRTILYNMGYEQAQNPQPQAPTAPAAEMSIFQMVQAISDARDSVDNKGKMKDQGVLDTTTNTANIVPTDTNSVVFSRTTTQVLRIVYGMGTAVQGKPTPGLFFPNGMNGVIK